MNLFAILPLSLRLAALFLLGAYVGGQLNRGIYRLAWRPRRIGPWSPPPEDAPARRFLDRVPILGWVSLAREAPLHGAGFWIRPLLIELCTGLGFAVLYWWEMRGGLLPPPARWSLNLNNDWVQDMLHAQYLSHILLISLMVVATFIDLDEQTIPDSITVPGTLAALALRALLPESQLPVAAPGAVDGLSAASPFAWPAWADGRNGLLLGLLFFVGWWFAVLPKTWTMRRGLKKSLLYLAASIGRQAGWRRVLLMAAIGSLAAAAVWWVGGPRWRSLCTALTGMAFGGGVVWAVRIVASRALAKEAMGFGDVTLMAMIGAFLGWQPALIVFFLAPFAALLIVLGQWILTGRRDIAFGPYLCLAALVLIVAWAEIWWTWFQPIFGLGWLVPAMLAICLVLMAWLLFLWRLLAWAAKMIAKAHLLC